MNLTNNLQNSNICNVLAKSSAGLGRSNSKGHMMTALFIAVFLCLVPSVMVGANRTPSGVLFPFGQSTNLLAFTTLCLVAPSGGYSTTTKGDNQMSIKLFTAQIRPVFAHSNNVSDLPFIKNIKGKITSYWCINTTGNYANDCLIGKSYAVEAIQFSMVNNDHHLLNSILADMPKSSDLTGIEIGFLSLISESTLKGAA